MRLADKVAIITGAGRGIGRAIALAYAREGARLTLAARTESELEETASMTEALGASTLTVPTDISQQADVEQMVQQTVEQFGTVDILVNNAAILGPMGPLQDLDPKAWVQTVNVNLVGSFLCCRAVLPLMLRQDRGKIILFAGGYSRAFPQLSAYVTSKWAVIRLAEALSVELVGANIQVNCLGPNTVYTGMIDELRAGWERSGNVELAEFAKQIATGSGDTTGSTEDLAVFLGGSDSGQMSGRMISALTDDFSSLPPRIPEIMASEAYQMRRVKLD